MVQGRTARVLGIIVGEYVATALPVASENIAHKYGLAVSPATIRNDMARLEEEGYISRPHTSAGAVPSDKGYRYYVEALAPEEELPLQERLLIRHQLHRVEREMEEWVRLAGAILAGLARNLALVTLPKAPESRFKRLELVSLQELLALLVLVISDARVKQYMLALEEPQDQEELSAIAERLNHALAGLTAREVLALTLPLAPVAEQVRRAVASIMEEEDARDFEEPRLEGVSHILSQPEFAAGARAAGVLEALEEGLLLRSFLPRALFRPGVRVIIGAELPDEAMRGCSVILSGYGDPDRMWGALGVVGPTRMHYDRAIPAVRFLSQVMSELVYELRG